jgi:hypothetical protein
MGRDPYGIFKEGEVHTISYIRGVVFYPVAVATFACFVVSLSLHMLNNKIN